MLTRAGEHFQFSFSSCRVSVSVIKIHSKLIFKYYKNMIEILNLIFFPCTLKKVWVACMSVEGVCIWGCVFVCMRVRICWGCAWMWAVYVLCACIRVCCIRVDKLKWKAEERGSENDIYAWPRCIQGLGQATQRAGCHANRQETSSESFKTQYNLVNRHSLPLFSFLDFSHCFPLASGWE